MILGELMKRMLKSKVSGDIYIGMLLQEAIPLIILLSKASGIEAAKC